MPSLPDAVQAGSLAEPYAGYARLRETDPVHRTPEGFWSVLRYDDVALVLRDPRFGRRGFGETAGSMFFQDPPEHTRTRGLVNLAFAAHHRDSLHVHIEQTASRLIDRVIDGRSDRTMDVMADFASPLPVHVIAALIGVPAADRDQFERWSVDIADGLDAGAGASSPALARGHAAHEAIAEYFAGLIAERRRRPEDDLLTALIGAEDRGERLNDAELLATCGLLFIAGHETTVNLIGNGVQTLLQHPAEWRRLCQNPGLVPDAVEEILRFESPVQRAGRMVNARIEIGGRVLEPGDIVSAMLGAANRDPAAFPEADRFDVSRRNNRHLAFGRGTHFCLGAPLARAEGRIAIGALLARLPSLALVDDRPAWRPSAEIRGLQSLPATF